MPPQTIHVPPLDVRAEVKSVNEEARTVDVIFSTGADVSRYDFWTGKRYIERLALKPSNVRLGRLNEGAPVLNTHSSYDISNVLGTVVDKSATVDGKMGTATLKFAEGDDESDRAWSKVRQGVVRNVSVGYRVYKFSEEKGKENELPVRTAIDWEPFEISLVPMGADPGARVRNVDTSETNACELIVRSEEGTVMAPKSPAKPEQRTSETLIEPDPKDPGAPVSPATRKDDPPAEPNDADRATAAERARVAAIHEACRNAKMPDKIMREMIDEGTSIEDAQRRCLQEVATRVDGGSNVPQQRQQVRVGEDNERVHLRSGITNALLHRVNPKFELDDSGRRYRGLSLMEIGKLFLRVNGVRITDMSPSEVAGAMLGMSQRAGYHSTSDFPNLLADVAHKNLRREYEESPPTYQPLVRVRAVADFKTINSVQFGDAPALVALPENGEIKAGTISEAKEAYALDSYASKFSIGRRALINDDLDAFARLPAMFARSARQLESDLVWAQITANALMADSNALFSAAHANIDSAGAGIGVDSLGAARAAIRKQTSLDGQKINLMPRYIIVPTALETEAEQVVMPLQPNSTAQVNPFSGKLTVIAEPRLDDDSSAHWYVAASPDQVDIVEVAMLEGEMGPMTESRVDFDTEGLEIKTRHDVAAKVLDYRGLYKNVGET